MTANQLEQRLKALAIDVIKLSVSLSNSAELIVIRKQLIRSVTSAAANYRASRNGRSKKEWYSKVCICVEEIDESVFWLDLMISTDLLPSGMDLGPILRECQELTHILSKTRASAKRNMATKP